MRSSDRVSDTTRGKIRRPSAIEDADRRIDAFVERKAALSAIVSGSHYATMGIPSSLRKRGFLISDDVAPVAFNAPELAAAIGPLAKERLSF